MTSLAPETILAPVRPDPSTGDQPGAPATPSWAANPAPAPPAHAAQPVAPDKPARPSRLARFLNNLVTAILVFAVAALLAVNVGPLVFPYRVYTVLSGSMEPTIPVGSEVVLLQVDASQIHVSDIITFQRPGHPDQLVTHRIVSTVKQPDGSSAWVTKGDANRVSDGWQIPAQGKGLRYAFHIPLIGYAFVMLQSPIGRIAFILAPALLLAAVVLNDVWKTEPVDRTRRRPGA